MLFNSQPMLNNAKLDSKTDDATRPRRLREFAVPVRIIEWISCLIRFII